MKSVRAPEIACLAVLSAAATWAACSRWPEPIWGAGGPDRLFPVLIGGKVGYIDRTGRLVLPAKFDPTCDPQVDAVTMATPDPYVDWRIHWARDFHEGRCAVRLGEKMVYIDTRGRRVCDELFDSAEDFSQGLARIGRSDKHGLLDTAGRVVLQPAFDRIHPFHEGLAWALRGGKMGMIDTAGRWVVRPQFRRAYRLPSGRSIVQNGSKRGVVDDAGRIILAPQFRYVWPAGDDVFVREKPGRWRVMDRKGRLLFRLSAECIRKPFSGGLLAVRRNGKWGYVDRSGKVVIAPQFARAGKFSEGLAAASRGGLYGYIDRAGNVVIDPNFTEARPFSAGMAPVRTSSGWGCIRRDGTFAIRPKYDFIGPFGGGLASSIIPGSRRGGSLRERPGRAWGDLADILRPDLAVVELWGKWGIIDRQGRLRTPAQLDWYVLRTRGLVFSEGRARIVRDGKVGYVGTGGRIAIRPRFDMAEPFSGGLARVMVWQRPPPDRPLARWGYIDRRGEWVWKPTR